MTTPNKQEKNQCDGCMSGIPVVDGMHQMGEHPTSLIGCTKNRYTSEKNLWWAKGGVQVLLKGGNCKECGGKYYSKQLCEIHYKKKYREVNRELHKQYQKNYRLMKKHGK